jgi:NAD/NADP transhydrogenase beta subunit
MILGRPTNLWLGLVTAVIGAVTVSAVALGADPTIVATLAGAFGGVAGALIALVAGQPPTVSPGDTIHVQTAAGQPNYVTTIATPPAQDPPPVVDPAKP